MEKNKRVLVLSIFILISAAVSGFADGGLELSITEWDTGLLEAGVIPEQAVEITNNTENAVEINLISTCSCLTTSADLLSIASGDSGTFTLFFDSSDDEGDFEKILIIQTDSDEMPKGFFLVRGSVDVPEKSAEQARGSEGSANIPAGSGLEYYYTPGCKSCNEFLRKAEIAIEKFDITEPQYYEQLQRLLSDRGASLREVPVMVTSDSIFQGEMEIREAYEALLEGRSIREAVNSGTPKPGGISLSVLPVMVAGLLDGINPCAFTTLIFLLSALAVAGRSRRETLIIGLFFTVSVFITYYLIGLGFFKIIRIADSFELVSRIIRWVLFSVLILFAVLSFYDYTKIRAGKAKDILLQLPGSVKRRLHSSIRTYSKSAALAGSSVVMGILISIFELGCTGQIYFPTIAYIIQTDEASSGYLYLALYNLAFILPLAAVFVIVFFGVTSKKITKMFQTNLGIIKILTGLLFLGFAALMLLL
ncbi:MAG: DUF1573 domain-containing protein [Spirochaetales bacterium]|nr:DUF1573 domain-containing protein [Spirochaetales bacterium]